MKERSFDEMIAYFNRRVSEMDIAQDYKMELLGMVTALGYKHEKTTQQWIPCERELSEIAKRVLVTLSNGNVIIAQHHTVKCGSEDTWVFEPTGLQFMYDKKTVVAWMPLPEPWRGEK